MDESPCLVRESTVERSSTRDGPIDQVNLAAGETFEGRADK